MRARAGALIKFTCGASILLLFTLINKSVCHKSEKTTQTKGSKFEVKLTEEAEVTPRLLHGDDDETSLSLSKNKSLKMVDGHQRGGSVSF